MKRKLNLQHESISIGQMKKIKGGAYPWINKPKPLNPEYAITILFRP
ncbi:MAG: hypothetical protein WBA74_18265 [Cyclobacteriaceae bacterium]